MGRIKTTPIKRRTLELFKKHQDRFSTDFTKNKELVEELMITRSKKIRNVIAGYITRLMGQEKAE